VYTGPVLVDAWFFFCTILSLSSNSAWRYYW